LGRELRRGVSRSRRRPARIPRGAGSSHDRPINARDDPGDVGNGSRHLLGGGWRRTQVIGVQQVRRPRHGATHTAGVVARLGDGARQRDGRGSWPARASSRIQVSQHGSGESQRAPSTRPLGPPVPLRVSLMTPLQVLRHQHSDGLLIMPRFGLTQDEPVSPPHLLCARRIHRRRASAPTFCIGCRVGFIRAAHAAHTGLPACCQGAFLASSG